MAVAFGVRRLLFASGGTQIVGWGPFPAGSIIDSVEFALGASLEPPNGTERVDFAIGMFGTSFTPQDFAEFGRTASVMFTEINDVGSAGCPVMGRPGLVSIPLGHVVDAGAVYLKFGAKEVAVVAAYRGSVWVRWRRPEGR